MKILKSIVFFVLMMLSIPLFIVLGVLSTFDTKNYLEDYIDGLRNYLLK